MDRHVLVPAEVASWDLIQIVRVFPEPKAGAGNRPNPIPSRQIPL
jgi:hypothetical protein